MGGEDEADPRWTGVAMVGTGAILILMGSIVVLFGLPTPGGMVYGTHWQNIILIFMIGAMLLLAGRFNLSGAREAGTETLSTPGPIDGDDGPEGAG
jgi:hypothetical protein